MHADAENRFTINWTEINTTTQTTTQYRIANYIFKYIEIDLIKIWTYVNEFTYIVHLRRLHCKFWLKKYANGKLRIILFLFVYLHAKLIFRLVMTSIL